MFVAANNCIEGNGINRDEGIGVYTDAARAMVGKLKGLVARIQSVATSEKSTKCTIHLEALAIRRMPAYI
jgi:hypothetical protein